MKIRMATMMTALTLFSGAAAEWGEGTFAVWPLKTGVPAQTSVVSWSDWLVFFDATFGKPGVRYVLNEMAASGIRTVWWRTFGGGHALYSSQVPGVTTGNYAGQGADYSQFDSLAEAVDFGHKLGLRVYAWYTPLEEAHGWVDNVRSRYADKHPEQWDQMPKGAIFRTPSFYFPAYREYKYQLGREMLDHGVDGMVIDFERRGAPGRSNNTGYIPEAVAEFNARFNRTGTPSPNDQEWIRFRAGWIGEFVERLRRDAAARDNHPELALMYLNNRTFDVNNDIPTLVKNNAADWYAIAVHGRNGSWGHVIEDPAAVRDANRKIVDKPVQVILYALMDPPATLAAAAERAVAGNCDIVWFETTYLTNDNRYSVPRRIAAADRAVILSPELDFTGGGEIQLVAAGKWTMRCNGAVIASGVADRAYNFPVPPQAAAGKLEISCELAADSPKAGVAVQGVAVDAAGRKLPFASDNTWSSDQGAVTTLALAGVPPFLAPLDKAIKPGEEK